MGERNIMRSAIRLTAVMVVMLASFAQGDTTVRAEFRPDLAPVVNEVVKRDLESLLEFYRDCHTHPELSLHEKESAERIAQRLEAAGYAVTRGVGGYGVVAVLANGRGPTVLVRGDMDALPITEETNLPYRSVVTAAGADGRPVGVMHACGHDAHMTCLVGTAEVLAKTRDRWSGTLVLIAQPAEEIGKGALAMIQDGLFERFPRPDYCLSLHVSGDRPAGTIGYTSGWAMANVDSVDITIHGRGGHGSRPNQAIDPVVAASQVIVALQTIVSRRVDPIEPAVITVGSVHSGSKHNIIPNEATMQLTVRSYTDQTRKTLLDGIREVTINTCRAMGCTTDPDVNFRDDEFTPAGYNDPALTAAAVEVMQNVIGAEQVTAVPARTSDCIPVVWKCRDSCSGWAASGRKRSTPRNTAVRHCRRCIPAPTHRMLRRPSPPAFGA
jgi:amidohydrolase